MEHLSRQKVEKWIEDSRSFVGLLILPQGVVYLLTGLIDIIEDIYYKEMERDEK